MEFSGKSPVCSPTQPGGLMNQEVYEGFVQEKCQKGGVSIMNAQDLCLKLAQSESENESNETMALQLTGKLRV